MLVLILIWNTVRDQKVVQGTGRERTNPVQGKDVGVNRPSSHRQSRRGLVIGVELSLTNRCVASLELGRGRERAGSIHHEHYQGIEVAGAAAGDLHRRVRTMSGNELAGRYVADAVRSLLAELPRQ